LLEQFVHRYVPAREPGSVAQLVLHGTGGDEKDLLPLARAIDESGAILSPRGRVLEHGMPRFFRRLAPGVFDEEDLRLRTHELARFVADARREYKLDPASIVALGYSNGANIAASLLLTHPDVLSGAILLRPMLPFEPTELPRLAHVPVRISAGVQDPMVPKASTERLAQVLIAAGADVTVEWYGTGHSLSAHEIEEAAEWFSRHFDAKR